MCIRDRDYAVNDAGEPDDMVYIGYNFHTGVNELALPKLAGKKKWYVVMDTAEQEHAFLPEEKLAENQHRITVRPQSVVLLLGKMCIRDRSMTNTVCLYPRRKWKQTLLPENHL